MNMFETELTPDEVSVTLTVNGRSIRRHIRPRTHLADFLRHELGLTGTHVGCEQGACGACTLFVDGLAVRSCLMQAVQAYGAKVTTIEGLADNPIAAALQAAFVERNAAQCGFCSPGMIATATEFLATELGRLPSDPTRNAAPSPQGGGGLRRVPSRAEIRHAISGNYCRCTGYHAIVDAIELAASRLVATVSQG